MSLAILCSRAQNGIDAPAVSVEVHLANGLPSLAIVGLPETAVKESRDRVRAALLNSRFEFPARRITINLAPADLPKQGGHYDLAIALGILAASDQINGDQLDQYEFIGELALSGAIRAMHGILPMALHTRRAGKQLILPAANAGEAALISGLSILPADSLLAVCAHINGSQPLPPWQPATAAPEPLDPPPDLADVCGQHHAKRALEIAAAGGHSLLMIGPPGTGKTMLASRLPGLLPPMTEEEAVESAAITAVSRQGFSMQLWRRRPFRTPHHTASGVALVGGGSRPLPGEISLAHHGVLFLDELPEFSRQVLEVLREPLESGRITISRALQQAEFPARFQLIAAMNPCPCGFLGDPSGRCHCSSEQVRRYRARLSGPLLDRIDMHIEVPAVPRKQWREYPSQPGTTSREIRQRVCQARQQQLQRCGKANHLLTPPEIARSCHLTEDDTHLLETASEQLGLSARAYHRILKVARTIADLNGAEQIASTHLGEAIAYRCLDRNDTPGWQQTMST